MKKGNEDFFTYTGVVNWECEKFKLEELSLDRFKCLIFEQELISSRDSEIRARILIRLKQNPKLILQAVVDECKRIISMRQLYKGDCTRSFR